MHLLRCCGKITPLLSFFQLAVSMRGVDNGLSFDATSQRPLLRGVQVMSTFGPLVLYGGHIREDRSLNF